MFKRGKKGQDKDSDIEKDLLDEFDEKYYTGEDDYEDDFMDEFDSKSRPQPPSAAEKKKEYYVKADDLKAELRKYQDSKKTDPERKRNHLGRAPD